MCVCEWEGQREKAREWEIWKKRSGFKEWMNERCWVVLTPVNLEQEHGRDVDWLEDDELNGMNGSDREGGGLLVGVMQLVEVDVQEWQVEDAMAPIS